MVKSPGLRVLPMFAVDGCDYGRQTSRIPPNPRGQRRADPRLRRRYQPHGAEPGVRPALRQRRQHHTDPQPDGELDRQRNLLQRDQVEGHRQGGVLPRGPRRPDRAERLPRAAGRRQRLSLHGEQPRTIRLQIPDAVAQTQAIWYVRVWSDISDPSTTNAGPTRQSRSRSVSATPVLECVAGSVDGNFGTLLFPRTDVTPSDNLPVNIMEGLEPPLTPDIHALRRSNGLCTNGVNGAVESSETNVPQAEQQLRRHRHRPDGEHRHPGLHHGCEWPHGSAHARRHLLRTARPTTTGTSAGSTWVPVPTST